jgi:hypothetical protein
MQHRRVRRGHAEIHVIGVLGAAARGDYANVEDLREKWVCCAHNGCCLRSSGAASSGRELCVAEFGQ